MTEKDIKSNRKTEVVIFRDGIPMDGPTCIYFCTYCHTIIHLSKDDSSLLGRLIEANHQAEFWELHEVEAILYKGPISEGNMPEILPRLH